jgi:integrase
MSISIKGAISQSNGRLKRDGYRVAIVLVREQYLYLQATLPPAPGSRKTKPHQQRISLQLPATSEAVKVAEKRARELGYQLQTDEFTWEKWRSAPTVQAANTADWLTRFESDYWARRSKTPKSETTWAIDYAGPFRRLDPYQPLTAAAILAAVKQTAPDTRARRRVCLALSALARFANLPIDLAPYKGNYGPASTVPRSIPSDAAIIAAWESIKSEEWRWAFGVLAAYGLRPHEVFACQFDRYPRLRVLAGKTGPRLVYPLQPEWPDRLELKARRLPHCSGRRNADLGHRVTQAFRRMGIPFAPYDLRHAWAVRAIGKFDLSIAAAMMGHSPVIHARTYQRWLGASDLDRAWKDLKR